MTVHNANDPDLDGFDTLSDLSSLTEDPSSQTPTPQSSRLLSLKTSSTLSSLAAKRKHLLRRSLSALENFPKEFSSLIHSHSFPRRFNSQRQHDSMNELELRPSLDMKLPCAHVDLDERPTRRTKLESRIYNFLTRSRSRSRSKQDSPSATKMHRASLDQRPTTTTTATGSKPASRIPSRPLSSTTSTTNSSTPRASKRPSSALPTPKVAPTQQQQVRENAAPSSRPTTPKSSVTKKTIHNLFGIPLALRRSSRSRSRSRPSSPQPTKDAPPVPNSAWYDDNPTPKARHPLHSSLTSRNPSPSRKPKSRASDPSPSLKLPKLFSGRTSTSTTGSISGASSLQPRLSSTAAASPKPNASVSLPLKRTTAYRRSTVPELPTTPPSSSSSHTRSGSGGSAVPNGKAVHPPKVKDSPPPSAMKPVSKAPSAPTARHGGHASSKNASMDASYRYRGGNMSIVEEESSIRTSVRTSLDVNTKPATPSLKGKAREETATPTSHLRAPTKMSASVRSTKHGSFDFERPGWLQRTGSNGTAISNLSEKSNYTAVTAPPASGDHHHREKETRESTGSGPGLAGVGTVQRDLSLKRAKDTEEQFRARERAQRLHEYVQRDKASRIPAANTHHSLGHARREGSTPNHSDNDANAHSTSTNATARTTGKDSSAGRASGRRIASALNGSRAGGSGSGIARLMGTAHHGLFSWEPPVPSPTRSTTSTATSPGDLGSSSRGGSVDRSGTSREEKLKYSGLSKGDRPAVPVPTTSSIPQRPGPRGRSLDLGIGLAWAPSTLKEEALMPSSLFARSASNASSAGRSASGSTTGKSATSSATNGGGGYEFGSNGSRSKRVHIQDGVDPETERTRMGKEVAEDFRNVLDDRGYNAFKSYVRQFDAHEIPFAGPKGIVERVERLLKHAPDRGREDNRALLDKFVRIILQNA